MPTEKPRISITLDPADLAVLDRFAAAAGQPRASFIAAMISAAVPEFERAAQVMELAKAAPAGVVKGVVESMSNATTDAMGLLAQAVDQSKQTITRAQAKSKAVRSEARSEGGDPLAGRGHVRTGAKRRNPPSDPHLLTGGSK